MFLPFQVEIEDGLLPTRQRAWAVWSLIVLCTAIHAVLFLVLSEVDRTDLFYRFGAARFRFAWWSPLTCTLLHGSWMHLVGNLYFLWIYGDPLERSVGAARFLVLYLVGACVSVGLHLLTVSPLFADEPTIGASGAISAVLGAFLVLWPTASMRCLFFSVISFRPIMVQAPAFVVLGLWFLGQLMYSLKLAGDVGGVAFWAHVAGFAAGAGMAYVYDLQRSREAAVAELAAKLPVLEAWGCWSAGDPVAMTRHVADIDTSVIEDTCGSCHSVGGLAALAEGDAEAGGSKLVLAFEQARDYRHRPAMLSIYLWLLRTFDAESVPWQIHRAAGLAAMELKQRTLALSALQQAIHNGCDTGLDVIARAMRALTATGEQDG